MAQTGPRGLSRQQSTDTQPASNRVARSSESAQWSEDHLAGEPMLIGKVNPLVWAAILLLGSLTALFWFTADAELDGFFCRETGAPDQTATREAGTGNSLPISTA